MAVVAVGATACSTGSGAHTKVTVFAAASLGDVFKATSQPFRSSHHGDSLVFSFAGSQQLAAQLQQGAAPDVVATADRASMAQIASHARRPPVVFAGNRLVIAVGEGNPHHIASLADLAGPGLKVVLAAPAVPAGKYAAQALRNANVTVHPVSLEDNVESVVTKVGLGEADAGIVYATDARVPGRHVVSVPIADSENVRADYLVGVFSTGAGGVAGQAFVSYLLSPKGQAILARFGFLPPAR